LQNFENRPMLLHGLLETIFVVELSMAVEEDFLPEPVKDVVEDLVAG
jgi:hypothetical protein